MNDSLVPVRVGECLCPGAPHSDGDVVYLRPKLGLAAGIAIQRMVVEANQSRPDAAEITGRLAEAYLLYGVAEWNLINDGGPIPVNAMTIQRHLLEDFTRGEAAADVADDLYMTAVLAPLLSRASKLSPGTSSNGSTSATHNGKAKRPKRSKPSSTTTIPTGDIATTSA